MAVFCGFLVILGRLWRVLWAEQGGAWLLEGLFGAVFAVSGKFSGFCRCV